MNNDKHQYAPGTRGARLLQLRDAVLLHELTMREVDPRTLELAVGMFVIHYSVPNPLAAQRLHKVSIWPKGAVPTGYSVYGNTVASFSWSDRDEIFIHDFKCGEWDNDLLRLLSSPEAGKLMLAG